MYGKIQQHLQNELNTIQENGLFKNALSLHHKEQRLQFQQEKPF